MYLNVAIILKSLSSTRTIMRVQPVGFWTRAQHGPQQQPICSLIRHLGFRWERRDSSQSLLLNFIGNHSKQQKRMGQHRGRFGAKKKPTIVYGSE